MVKYKSGINSLNLDFKMAQMALVSSDFRD